MTLPEFTTHPPQTISVLYYGIPVEQTNGMFHPLRHCFGKIREQAVDKVTNLLQNHVPHQGGVGDAISTGTYDS